MGAANADKVLSHRNSWFQSGGGGLRKDYFTEREASTGYCGLFNYAVLQNILGVAKGVRPGGEGAGYSNSSAILFDEDSIRLADGGGMVDFILPGAIGMMV